MMGFLPVGDASTLLPAKRPAIPARTAESLDDIRANIEGNS